MAVSERLLFLLPTIWPHERTKSRSVCFLQIPAFFGGEESSENMSCTLARHDSMENTLFNGYYTGLSEYFWRSARPVLHKKTLQV